MESFRSPRSITTTQNQPNQSKRTIQPFTRHFSKFSPKIYSGISCFHGQKKWEIFILGTKGMQLKAWLKLLAPIISSSDFKHDEQPEQPMKSGFPKNLTKKLKNPTSTKCVDVRCGVPSRRLPQFHAVVHLAGVIQPIDPADGSAFLGLTLVPL